ncbi:MAG: putative AdoMet-dependent methyltransferase [Clostridium sp.]|jgi:putative AdoMet-dependent methyltransferase
MLNSTGFDLWANGYDNSVNFSEKNNEYPFAGYKDVLNYVYNQVREKDGANILDIGFGTGILTTQLYNNGYSITGIDFSSNMIDIAKQKMPQATLINHDFSKGLPDQIKNHHFDFIISTYAIHHLTDKEKINFIKLLFPLLNKTGMILLGDVSFETRNQLEKCKSKYNEYWDNDEFYFTVEEIKNNLNDEYFCEYVQISHCAGILTIVNNNFV